MNNTTNDDTRQPQPQPQQQELNEEDDLSVQSSQHPQEYSDDGLSDASSSSFLGWDHSVRQSVLQEAAATNNTSSHSRNNNYPNDYRQQEKGLSSPYSFCSSSSSISESTQWSLNVKLNSVVDLPSFILPNVPLCPFLKFSLLEIKDEEQLQQIQILSAAARRAEFEQTKDEKKRILPQTSIRLSKGILADFQRFQSLVDCAQALNTDTVVRTTAGKIMSPKDNGMMEWHEDLRWDNISDPLQTVLCIELSARAVYPHNSSTAASTPHTTSMDKLATPQRAQTTGSVSSRPGLGSFAEPSRRTLYENMYENAMKNPKESMQNHKRSSTRTFQQSFRASATGAGNEFEEVKEEENNQARGIMGMWRKGRLSLANVRRKRRSNASASMTNSSSTTDMSSRHSSLTPQGMEFDGHYASFTSASDPYMEHPVTPILERQESIVNPNATSDGDLRLGTLIIPISNLPLEDEIPHVEKWYQFDTHGSASRDSNGSLDQISAPWRDPTVLLDISLATCSTLNLLEDEVFNAGNNMASAAIEQVEPPVNIATAAQDHMRISMTTLAGSQDHLRTSMMTLPGNVPDIMEKEESKSVDVGSQSVSVSPEQAEKIRAEELERIKINGPFLEAGIVDFIAVVGAKNIGPVKTGSRDEGWIDSEPECAVLEQFPKNDFHHNNGRNVVLPEGVEHWCFPEGCRIWRGKSPPMHMDINLKRFSAASPPRMASSVAAFDACLNCTSSFMWWVLSSNSDEYGSSISKTYGAVIRFYAEVPQIPRKNEEKEKNDSEIKTWCPMGICVTSSLPIIGILESVLLRLCEKLSSQTLEGVKNIVHADLRNLILNYQRPLPGVLHCSIPFLSGDGDRLHVSLPPIGGLPALPHGASVTSVCRLLQAEGLTALLAAVLTECKILVHSADIANLAMVAEVITALMYPFQWQLPCIPVLPLPMITFVEAPVSYFIGIPTCNMKFVDKNMLSDVVVIDLDNGFSTPDYIEGSKDQEAIRALTPLPASVSSNISKAVFRLLRDEDDVQEQFGTSVFSDSRHLYRLEGESLAERDFRISIAHQICSLIRGYQECLFFVSAQQPVFNRDRFLRQAPALYEERRHNLSSPGQPPASPSSYGKIVSPRSKRFLSGLVNSQHFHALLENLDDDGHAFFHEIMETYQEQSMDESSHYSHDTAQKAIVSKLRTSLESLEQKIPTYHSHNQRLLELKEDFDDFSCYEFMSDYFSSFTSKMLVPAKGIIPPPTRARAASMDDDDEQSVMTYMTSKLSLEELVALDKIPWKYKPLFEIETKPSKKSEQPLIWKKIHLKEALGERKFNEWKIEQEMKNNEEDLDQGDLYSNSKAPLKSALDLTKLMSNMRNDADEMGRGNFTKLMRGSSVSTDKTVVKDFIEKAYEVVDALKEGRISIEDVDAQFEEMNAEVDAAMKNPAAQKFLMAVLTQRSRLQIENQREQNRLSVKAGSHIEVSTSNLHPLVFDCLYRLCSSMLEACYADSAYDSAYKLLIHTTGFCTADDDMMVSYMTKQIATHVIYSDLSLWDRVLLIHKQDRQRDKSGIEGKPVNVESMLNEEYEATVSTLYEMLGYGMQADTLAKFAYRVAIDKFYSTDKEEKLLTLARRLAVKCEEAVLDFDDDDEDAINDEDIDFSRKKSDVEKQWETLIWTHPSLTDGNSVSPYTDQAPITQLASYGGSIIATGALDGSVYLASTLHLDRIQRGSIGGAFVRGYEMEWPETPQPPASNIHSPFTKKSRPAVTGLVLTNGSVHTRKKSVTVRHEYSEEDEKEEEIELGGKKLVAGNKYGEIVAWDVADAMGSILIDEYSYEDNEQTSVNSYPKKRMAAPQPGVCIGSHRGGITSLSVPPQTYRPDSLVSGGNDGLIKVWKLRTQARPKTANRRTTMGGRTSRMLFSQNDKAPGKDKLDVLAGHGGKILCIEVAWHGDRLLSGAADRTVKLWDLASQSGGRCLQTMHGHTGWVTHGQYWGRNTIISASSDRSCCIWDSRSGSAPLFVLRYHNSPISSMYLENRTSYWMTTAANDGSIGTWDFRMMKTLNGDLDTGNPVNRTNSIRYPLARMNHCNQSSGPVLLRKGVSSNIDSIENSLMSVGVDNVVRQWDAMNGSLIDEYEVNTRSKISCFKTFSEDESIKRKSEVKPMVQKFGGTICTTWDGTVNLRQLTHNS